MRRLGSLCVMLFAAFTLNTIATAAASAEEGFLPSEAGSVLTFKATGEKQILETEKKSKFTCTSMTGTASSVNDKHADKVTLDYDGCKALGLEVNSLGDKGGLVLIAEALALVCLLSAGGFGVIIEQKELHTEVPSIGTLVLIRGSVIGELKPVGTEPSKEFSATFTQSGAGKQSITACNDKVNHKLEMSTSGGAFEPASVAFTGVTLTEGAVELMDS